MLTEKSVELTNSHNKKLTFNGVFHHVDADDTKDKSSSWEIQNCGDLENPSHVRIFNLEHRIYLSIATNDKVIASDMKSVEEKWTLHQSGEDYYNIQSMSGTFLAQANDGSLTNAAVMNKNRLWKISITDSDIPDKKPVRKVRESAKKEVVAKQEHRCKNSPGSKIKSLEDYDCLLWKKPAPSTGIFDLSGYQVDHIVPWCETHDNSIENLQALCPSCHGRKTTAENIARPPRSKKKLSSKRKFTETEEVKVIKLQESIGNDAIVNVPVMFPVFLKEIADLMGKRECQIKRMIIPELSKSSRTNYVEGKDFIRTQTRSARGGRAKTNVFLSIDCFSDVCLRMTNKDSITLRMKIMTIVNNYRTQQ